MERSKAIVGVERRCDTLELESVTLRHGKAHEDMVVTWLLRFGVANVSIDVLVDGRRRSAKRFAF